jgi:hypothetical protein
MGHGYSSTHQALGGLPHQAPMMGMMSLIGPSRPTAARQFFGRYLGHSVHRDAWRAKARSLMTLNRHYRSILLCAMVRCALRPAITVMGPRGCCVNASPIRKFNRVMCIGSRSEIAFNQRGAAVGNRITAALIFLQAVGFLGCLILIATVGYQAPDIAVWIIRAVNYSLQMFIFGSLIPVIVWSIAASEINRSSFRVRLAEDWARYFLLFVSGHCFLLHHLAFRTQSFQAPGMTAN